MLNDIIAITDFNSKIIQVIEALAEKAGSSLDHIETLDYFIEGISIGLDEEEEEEHYYGVVWYLLSSGEEDEECESYKNISDGTGYSIWKDEEWGWWASEEDQGVALDGEDCIVWRNPDVPKWFREA